MKIKRFGCEKSARFVAELLRNFGGLQAFAGICCVPYWHVWFRETDGSVKYLCDDGTFCERR